MGLIQASHAAAKKMESNSSTCS